jgi:hypothetical protein
LFFKNLRRSKTECERERMGGERRTKHCGEALDEAARIIEVTPVHPLSAHAHVFDMHV